MGGGEYKDTFWKTKKVEEAMKALLPRCLPSNINSAETKAKSAVGLAHLDDIRI